MSTWRVERLRGGAGELHARDALAEASRSITVLDVDAPALVLGSTQRDDVVDRAAADRLDVEIARRRTGGGAVVLLPGEHVWIDVTIPSDDPLWRDDVAAAFGWLGDTWVATLEALGVAGVRSNEAAVCHSPLGRLICFAGLGYGEVTAPGGKVVGVAQRRSRAGAWFQCAVLQAWEPAVYGSVLAPGLQAATDDVAGELAAIRVQPVDRSRDVLVDAFLAHLPA